MNACPDRVSDGQRGLALVLTLLVLVLLVTAVLEFDRSTRTSIRAAGNFRDGMKAFHLATSGVAAAQAVLRDDLQKKPTVDDLTELWATPYPPYPVGDGTVALAIQDEGGKLNINALVTTNGEVPKDDYVRQELRALFTLKEFDPDVVDAIVDWLDWNDIPEPRGAEGAYYQGLDRPYASRNYWIDTLSELHLVKGVTDEVFRAISSYLTVYPVKPGGPYKVNVNTADPIVLQALVIRRDANAPYEPALSAEEVDRIVAARPFKTMLEFANGVGMSDTDPRRTLLQQQLDVKSSFFSVYSEGEVNGVKKAVIAVVNRPRDQALTYWRLAD
ncbi:MAG: type II secretion system minor pseudopilin GspK [Nitrospirota bacterium]